MRKLIIVICLFVATAASAQQNKPNGFYVFITNPGYASEPAGHGWNGAFGVALQRMFSPRFSGEVAVSHDTETFVFRSFTSGGTLLAGHQVTAYSLPVDLTARYHFLNDSSWKPYIGAEARYVDSRAFFGMTGGVVWQFRPALGLRFDSKLLVSDRPVHGERLYNSIGLSWRF